MPEPSSGSGEAFSASEYTVGALFAGLPVVLSSRSSLIPLQNEPNDSHLPPEASVTSDGSIALSSSAVVVRNTSPSSVQWYFGLRGSSVGVVASPMTELFDPKLEPA